MIYRILLCYSGGSAVDGGPNGPLAYIVTDSRGNNFDNTRIFSQPSDFAVRYCIVRGAGVKDLQNIFVHKLETEDIRSYFPIIVKIAVGINDFTTFVNNKHNERELKYSGANAVGVFEQLLSFKTVIKEKIPKALVGFVTVPPVSLLKYRDYCVENKNLLHSELSDTDLKQYQKELEGEVKIFNEKITFENCQKQEGHLKGCRTVSWHRSVCRLGKIKRGKKYQKVYKNDFRGLYDGIHGTSELKQKWFSQLVLAIRAEINYTRAEASPQEEDLTSDNSDVELEGDNSWDFKRGQLTGTQ